MKSYVPETFQQQPVTAQANRRKDDALISKSIEIIEQMNEESKAVNAEVRRMLDDAEKMLTIRFDHVDANIQQIREDNKVFYDHLLQRMDEKHATQDARIDAVEGCVDDAVDKLGKEIKEIKDEHSQEIREIKNRVKTLEDAPVKKSASRWDQASEKILWGLVGLVIAGGVAWISTALSALTGGGQK